MDTKVNIDMSAVFRPIMSNILETKAYAVTNYLLLLKSLPEEYNKYAEELLAKVQKMIFNDFNEQFPGVISGWGKIKRDFEL